MTEQQINHLVLERFGRAQNGFGRWRLNFYAQWKRVSWRLLIASTYFVKRFFDIIASTLLLVAVSPVLALVCICIKLEDGGPILFPQVRIGRLGRPFTMYKFRSMCLGAENQLGGLLHQNQHREGVTFKLKNDPRITRVGRWLRKFSLDEFPQLINVLKGEMSLVGPRPPLPREVALYSMADRRRLMATPGLTCFWQIGGRSEIDFPEQVQLDVQYIESQSFWVDIKILLKTVPAVLTGKGAC